MQYKDFVNELRPLLEKAKDMFNLHGLHENQVFRKWRHDVSDLIKRIKANGYDINSRIAIRLFDDFNTYYEQERINAFNRDLQDTINELESIVTHYDKYGDPKEIQTETGKNEQLEWPQKITLSWLYKHAPIGLWIKVAGILITVFAMGISVGQSKIYGELTEKLSNKTEPNGYSKHPQ